MASVHLTIWRGGSLVAMVLVLVIWSCPTRFLVFAWLVICIGLRSLVSLLFIQQLVLAYVKYDIKTPYYWPFVRGIHQWLVDSPHKWPVIWESFHFMTWCLSWCQLGHSMLSFSECLVNELTTSLKTCAKVSPNLDAHLWFCIAWW